MRVLHVVESMVPEAGSIAVTLGGLFDSLRARGVDSETLALSGGRCAIHREEAQRFVARADLIHLHGWGRPLARRIAVIARRASKPYVVSPHGALGNRPRFGRRLSDRLRSLLSERRVVRHAAAIAAVNEAERRQLDGRRGPRRTVCLPYGIDIGEYDGGALPASVSPEPSDGPCLLLLGPIHPLEGVVPLLKAFAELGSIADGWNIVLAGPESGDWRKMLEAAIRRKGGEKRVLFAPAGDLAAQRAWLARASILAAPRLHVGCGVTIMQALASGVPVLASTLVVPQGMAEVIQVCGPTRHEIKMALRALLKMPERERLARADRARAAVRARLSWPVVVEDYIRLYRTLIRNATDE